MTKRADKQMVDWTVQSDFEAGCEMCSALLSLLWTILI